MASRAAPAGANSDEEPSVSEATSNSPSFSTTTGKVHNKRSLLKWVRLKTKTLLRPPVTNFTTSWADGMAFCALLHSFSKRLVRFETRSARNASSNLKLAFRVAEKQLGIPRTIPLDAFQDPKKIDETLVLEYLSAMFKRMQQPLSNSTVPDAVGNTVGTGDNASASSSTAASTITQERRTSVQKVRIQGTTNISGTPQTGASAMRSRSSISGRPPRAGGVPSGRGRGASGVDALRGPRRHQRGDTGTHAGSGGSTGRTSPKLLRTGSGDSDSMSLSLSGSSNSGSAVRGAAGAAGRRSRPKSGSVTGGRKRLLGARSDSSDSKASGGAGGQRDSPGQRRRTRGQGSEDSKTTETDPESATQQTTSVVTAANEPAEESSNIASSTITPTHFTSSIDEAQARAQESARKKAAARIAARKAARAKKEEEARDGKKSALDAAEERRQRHLKSKAAVTKARRVSLSARRNQAREAGAGSAAEPSAQETESPGSGAAGARKAANTTSGAVMGAKSRSTDSVRSGGGGRRGPPKSRSGNSIHSGGHSADSIRSTDHVAQSGGRSAAANGSKSARGNADVGPPPAPPEPSDDTAATQAGAQDPAPPPIPAAPPRSARRRRPRRSASVAMIADAELPEMPAQEPKPSSGGGTGTGKQVAAGVGVGTGNERRKVVTGRLADAGAAGSRPRPSRNKHKGLRGSADVKPMSARNTRGRGKGPGARTGVSGAATARNHVGTGKPTKVPPALWEPFGDMPPAAPSPNASSARSGRSEETGIYDRWDAGMDDGFAFAVKPPSPPPYDLGHADVKQYIMDMLSKPTRWKKSTPDIELFGMGGSAPNSAPSTPGGSLMRMPRTPGSRGSRSGSRIFRFERSNASSRASSVPPSPPPMPPGGFSGSWDNRSGHGSPRTPPPPPKGPNIPGRVTEEKPRSRRRRRNS